MPASFLCLRSSSLVCKLGLITLKNLEILLTNKGIWNVDYQLKSICSSCKKLKILQDLHLTLIYA